MKKVITTLLIFVLFSSVVVFAKVKKQSPQKMILDFYTQYSSTYIDDEKYRNNLLQKYCSKKMLDTMKILYSFDEKEGLIIGIDYDIFLKAQDIRPIDKIKIENYKENIYKVYWTDDKDTVIQIFVIKEDNNWKIDSLDSYDFEKTKKEVEQYWLQKKQ